MKNLENPGQKVILFHRCGGDGISFDLLAHKDIEPLARDEVRNDVYEVDCPRVAEFLKQHPDYVYIGSEDLGHTYSCNLAVFNFITELIYKLGWQKIDVEG